jgi:hypothetical protein
MSHRAFKIWQKLRGSLSPQGCLALLEDRKFTKELHRDSTLFVQYIHKITRLRSVENSQARTRVVSEPPCIELKHINQALNCKSLTHFDTSHLSLLSVFGFDNGQVLTVSHNTSQPFYWYTQWLSRSLSLVFPCMISCICIV